MCSEKNKVCLGCLMKQVWLQAQQICTSAFPQKKKKPGAQLKSPYDDQANSDSINHATFEIFSNTGFQFSTRQRKQRERERKEREKVHYGEKDFNVFNTHYSPRLASVRPPSTPICHSQRAYDAAIWKTEIIRGVGGQETRQGEADG